MTIDVCVAFAENHCIASAYDVPSWGLMAEATNEESALAELVAGEASVAFARFLERHGEHPRVPTLEEVRVIERRQITADEQAFERDHRTATDEELNRTLQVLEWARSDLLEMLSSATDEELDWGDPHRVLPDWAWWRTPRQMALHIAITESHYYLRNLGVTPPALPIVIGEVPTTTDLRECLRLSAEHVRRVLPQLPRDLAFRYEDGQEWTTTKSIWRLAWHERGENDVIRDLLAQAPQRVE